MTIATVDRTVDTFTRDRVAIPESMQIIEEAVRPANKSMFRIITREDGIKELHGTLVLYNNDVTQHSYL